MKVSGSRPVFPHFDYLTTRQLTNRPDCCQLQPAGCLLLFALCAMRFAPCAPRPLVSVSPCLRASLSPVLRFSRSPFPLLHAWAPLLLRSRDCQLPAASCQLLPRVGSLSALAVGNRALASPPTPVVELPSDGGDPGEPEPGGGHGWSQRRFPVHEGQSFLWGDKLAECS